MKVSHRSRHFRWLMTLIVSFFGCDYVHGTKQVRTTADLQTIVGRVESHKSLSTVSEMERLIAATVVAVNHGRDAWENPYVWRVRATPGGVSYVVVSPGSDGQLDVSAIDDYFSKPGLVVLKASEHERDIVFRDGEAIVTGGK